MGDDRMMWCKDRRCRFGTWFQSGSGIATDIDGCDGDSSSSCHGSSRQGSHGRRRKDLRTE